MIDKDKFYRNIKSRILIISDSHGKNSNISDVLKKAGPFDMMLHAGDLECDPKTITGIVDGVNDTRMSGETDTAGFPCYFVRGNCDWNGNLPAFQVIEVEGHRIFLTHGHRYYVNGGTQNLEYAALEQGCDIAVYGHTHVPAVIRREDITVVNPGSVSFPRQTPRRKTFMIMEIYKDGTVDFNLVELKKRGDQV